MDKIVTSIHQIDISDLRFPIIAAYEHPEDYPNKCVARIFDMDRATDTVILKIPWKNFIRISEAVFLQLFSKQQNTIFHQQGGCWIL